MRPGERVIEWCWYDACDASTQVFTDYMTDVDGVRHYVTVPGNLLRPEVWKAQLERREATLSPTWKKIFHEAEKMPLLTAIRAFDNTRASFYSGKLLLVGEAFIQVQRRCPKLDTLMPRKIVITYKNSTTTLSYHISIRPDIPQQLKSDDDLRLF
jgi:hypothetical protein